MTRVTAGNFTIDTARIDLSALVHAAADRVAVAAQMADAPIEREIQPQVIGLWDRMALEQVVDNLLSNAVKFGGGQPVSISLWSRDGVACITVRDRGVGISAADQQRIFQRFERAVARREHGGFGVGLWLANQLVQAMGGSITVDSRIGEGASFTVRLPIHQSETET